MQFRSLFPHAKTLVRITETSESDVNRISQCTFAASNSHFPSEPGRRKHFSLFRGKYYIWKTASNLSI